MPLGDRHVHHHGLLAGLGAGTAGVLFAFGVLALAWHRVAGQVSAAVAVLAYAVMAAVAIAVFAGVFYVFLWVRHRARNPDLLAGRRAVRAEVISPAVPAISAASVPELPAADVPAIEPARPEIHYHFDSADAVEAAMRAMQERPDTENHYDPS